MLTARIPGIIEAEEKNGRANRNDRLLAVPSLDSASASVHPLDDAQPELLDQIERFFKVYGESNDKQWRTIGRGGPGKVLEVIRQASQARKRTRQISKGRQCC